MLGIIQVRSLTLVNPLSGIMIPLLLLIPDGCQSGSCCSCQGQGQGRHQPLPMWCFGDCNSEMSPTNVVANIYKFCYKCVQDCQDYDLNCRGQASYCTACCDLCKPQANDLDCSGSEGFDRKNELDK